MTAEQQYLDLCKLVLDKGVKRMDRTNTGTYSVFGHQMRYDLSEGFPLLTTKSVPFRLIASELLWFIKGDTNIRYLLENNNNIWNEWAFKRWVESDEYTGPDMTDFGNRSLTDAEFKEEYDEQMEFFKEKVLEDDEFAKKYGDLGFVYGKQWRDWKTSQNDTIDQLHDVIQEIKNNPYSRRHIVSAWNPEDIPHMALPPCHTLAKALLEHKDKLRGTVVFIHQHAEELAPGGAKPIIESGELDDIDAIFGTHLWATEPVGVLQVSKDALMAGADRFEIHIQGQGGHGAAPHETKDSIMVGTQIVTQIQQIVSRRISPLDTAVVTVGTFHAGSAFNVIADTAVITGTVRYLDEKVQQKVIEELEAIINGVCQSFHATYDLKYEKGYPPVINHADAAEVILNMKDTVPGIDAIDEVKPVMGGEDFAYYLHEKPGAYFFTGANKPENDYPHHHPKFDFDEEAMKIAAKSLIAAYEVYQDK